MRYLCDDCGMVWDREECPDVKNPGDRHEVGGPWTDKECPDCGALCYRLPGIVVRWNKVGIHVEVRVFMGTDIEHVALTGTLRMRELEWELFQDMLSKGNAGDLADLHLKHEEVCDGLDMP